MTYEADQDGVLQIVAAEGETLPIGAVIAHVGAPGEAPVVAREAATANGQAAAATGGTAAEAAGEAAAGARPGPAPAAPPAAPDAGAPGAVPAEPAGELGADGRVKASPVARRMAREAGIDLRAVRGTGPGGRIVKADVDAALAGGVAAAPQPAMPAPPMPPAPETPAAADVPTAPGVPPAPPAAPPPPPVAAGVAGSGKGEVRYEELSRTQQLVARRMAESKATVPDFTLHAEVDMDGAVALRAQLKSLAGDGGVVPSFNDMIVKASALALREHPRANGAYKDGRFELYERVNVGIAVAAQDSLVVPTIFDADHKSLGEIAREARVLAERVRAGAVTPPELSGGTFTVSNLGMYGVTSFTAVINPPQAAILAVGAVRQVPVVRDGQLVPGNRMSITLACDHRILYGAPAAEFLARIRELLEQPLALAL
jgi:pyruvate dehydrogenase E2 component (dihydrolipoamide acetyltransferase)